jgi:hypothetical protein
VGFGLDALGGVLSGDVEYLTEAVNSKTIRYLAESKYLLPAEV